MKKKPLFLSILAMTLVSFAIINQNDFFKKVEQNLESYTENHPEKIFIHTDKPYYATDEDLWFTTYLVNGISLQKTLKSRVVHVELMDQKDSIVARKKLYVHHTSVAGDFKIKKSFKPGKYTLRAYTKYMRNHGSDYYFQKEIPVYQLDKKDSLSNQETSKEKLTTTPKANQPTKKVKESKPEIKFYPEGGYLVANTQNKVAFEVSDGTHEINLEATVKDKEGNEILTIKTLKMGIGSFLFIPEQGKEYYASIKLNGKEEKYPLPKALDSGYTLNITNYGKYLIANINATVENGLQGVHLVAHERGKLLHKHYEETNKSNHIIKIPTTNLSDGIVNFTLFDNEGRPVAERLVYVDNPNNNLKININKSSEVTNSRKKVTLQFDVTDKTGTSTPTSLSLAVRDLKAFPYNNKSGNIKSWLLLNSDLKGAIHKAGYFFEKENDAKTRYLLDLVMMTKGWRRFSWQEIINKQDSIPTYKPETGLYISGTTKNLKRPYTEKSCPTNIVFYGTTEMQEQQSDSLGKFKYGPFRFFDSIPVIIQARLDRFGSTRRKSRNVVILVDKDRPDTIQKSNVFFNKKNNITSDKERQIETFVKVTQYIKEEKFKYDQEIERLDQITLIARKKTELEKRQDEMNSLTDYGAPMSSANRMDVLTDVLEAGTYTALDLVSQMNGVSVFSDTIYLRRNNNPARVMLDGLEVDGSFLQSINGDEISFIDILQGADAATFMNAGNGVIALYSSTGNVGSRSVKRKPGIIDFHARGFYTARKFYKPDHVNGFEDMNKADLRTTLHWEPIVRVTSKGTAEVSFFTSDLKSDYLIEIQGISDTGVPIQATSTFVVE
ncbi:hypothetical protein [Wenyingzhuangia sp. IMCC45574]